MRMFEQWEKEDSQVAGSGVRFALEAGQDIDAAGAAKAFGMAKQLGMPEQAVLQDQRKAERELRAREIERNPFLAKWAEEDAVNAAFAKEDPELHGVFEHAAKLSSDVSENIEGIGRSWERGNIALERMRLGGDKDFRERVRTGDPEALAKMEEMDRQANPYYDQDAYGILHPGTLAPMQPLRQAGAQPEEGSIIGQIAGAVTSIATQGHIDGQVVEDVAPLQQELDDIFSVAPYMHMVDGKVVLLQSMGAYGQHISKEEAVAKWLEDRQHAGIFASPGQAHAFLSLPSAKQRELYAGWQEKPQETWVESLVGPGGAIEQLPRTIFHQLPLQAKYGMEGGMHGAMIAGGTALLLGQAGPQAFTPEEAFTVPAASAGGFTVGMSTGWLVGTARAAYEAEYNTFSLEMAAERDANGQPLSGEAVEVASQAYAVLAAGIEVVGEKMFLSLLKPLGLADIAAGQGAKSLAKSAVRRAMMDRSQGAHVLDTLARLGINGIIEGGEEGAQEALGILVGFLVKEGSNAFGDSNFINNRLFTAENAGQVADAAKAGASAGFWMQSGPILISGAFDVQRAKKAESFAQAHMDLHARVENTNTKKLSPEHMQSALESVGPVMLEKVNIPADAALELYQSGIDIISPMGITEQEITDMAGKGHDMVVKVSALHARLDAQQFEAAEQIMRRGDDAASVADAVAMAERDSLNAEKVQEICQQQVTEEEAYQEARGKLHAEFAFNMESLPGLKAQAESQAGSVSAYLDNVLALADSVLPRLAAISGESKTELLSKIVPRMMEAKLASDGNAGLSYEYFQAAKKSIYSDDRSVKMTFEETGVEPSFEDRGQLREYLNSLDREDIKALKSNDPDVYLQTLQDIVQKVFPGEGGLRFRTENGVLDYEHLLTDVTRQNYIESLPRTLKDEDIRLEFTTPEGEAKAYFIKKYLDVDTQKDIWDFLVIRDGELKTKIARIGQKGRGYAEARIEGAGNEASHSASLGGNMENASTPLKYSENNITTDEVEVNSEKNKKLFQPLNPGVDLNAQIPVVFADVESVALWQAMKGAGRKSIVDAIAGGIHNEPTGEYISLSRKNAEHLISSATGRGIGGQPHIAAVRQVRELLRVAEKIETYSDRKQQEGVKFIHRFFAPMLYDSSIYAVNMTVKEYAGERLLEVEGVSKLYDLKLESKTPVLLVDELAAKNSPVTHPTGVYNITIRQLLSGVKDSEGNLFFQGLEASARGSISFTQNATIIRLFQADLSTFSHEIGHLFVKDMENLVATGQAPEQITKDLEALKGFAAEFKGKKSLQAFYENVYRKQRKEFQQRSFKALSAEEIAQVRYVAEQEKLADAFVTYLREGKTPSPELGSVFQRFRVWLQKIYQAIAGSDVQINDEVRAVFDRMLASEEEIAIAEKMHRASEAEINAFDEVAGSMLTEAEQARMLEARSKAGEVSRERRLQKVLQAYYRAGINMGEVRQQARAEVDAMPVYAAQDMAIQEGGISYDYVVQMYGADTAKAVLKKRPGLLRKDGTVPLDELAIAHGFTGEEGLIEAIRNADGKAVNMKNLVARHREALEANIREEFDLDKGSGGDEDYYSDERLTELELQSRALNRKVKAPGRTAGTAAAVRGMARKILEAMPHREALNIGRLSHAEAKQATKAAKALADGKLQEAAEAKRRQMITHAMVLEAMEYRRSGEVFNRALKRYLKSDRMIFAHQEQIRALVGRYALLPNVGPLKPDEREPVRSFIKEIAESSIWGELGFSDAVLSEQVLDRAMLKKLTLGELDEVRGLIRWIAEEGSPGEAKLLAEGESGTVEAAVNTGLATLASSGNQYVPKSEGTLGRKAQDAWMNFFAGQDHTIFMLMAADGYKEVGKNSHMVGFHSGWFQKVMDGQNRYLGMFRQARPELERIGVVREGFVRRFEKKYGRLANEINGVVTPEVMKEVGRNHWTAEHIWCLARNMGNAGNLKTLYEGYGLSPADLQRLTSVLGKAEWLAIQAEGEMVSRHYEETDSVFRKIYGRPMPDRVEPQPFAAMTAEGEVVNMPGWYFPISTDGRLSPDIGDRQEIDLVKGAPEFVAYGPTLEKGFTKSRTGTGKPSALHFGVFDAALQDQWRFMNMAPVVRDMDRITRNPEWRKAYTKAFGPDYYKELRSWLKYTARPVVERGDGFDRFMNNERKRATVFILGLNVRTFFRQFEGYPQAKSDLGAKWIAKGMLRSAINPVEHIKYVNEQSAYMADRDKNFMQELRKSVVPPKGILGEIIPPIKGRVLTAEDVQGAAMSLVTLGDRMTTYPIWQGAYMKATQALGMNHDEAIAFANRLIQKTQASNTAADLNSWQRTDGKSLKRIFTMFTSETLRKGSRMRYHWRALEHGTITYGEYASHLVSEMIVPAVYFSLIKTLLSSGDDEDFVEAFLGEATSNLLTPVPIVGPAVENMLGGRGNRSIADSPMLTGIRVGEKLGSGIVRLVKDPTDEKAQAAFFKALVDVAAYGAGTGDVRRVFETAAMGWEDLEMGRTKNPFRLFFRKPKK